MPLHSLFTKRGTIYISIKPQAGGAGGGANTFSWNLHRYLAKNGVSTTRNLFLASKAIVIAHKVNFNALWLAKKKGCYIIHRLDEYFEGNESEFQRKKHAKIIRINKLADVTVFQSNFVKDNVLPHLETQNWEVIINGADPVLFRDEKKKRDYIGHVTNSIGDRKCLGLLEKVISKYPNEKFLLVGNHKKSSIGFSRYPNVRIIGAVSKNKLAEYYQMMKCLYFPSEADPCPNTVVEAILSGVPVCYNPVGGTVEIVRNCGMPLDQFDGFLQKLLQFNRNCRKRYDLHFDSVAQEYLSL